jgi:acyl-CoA-dependent ceramide synthase
MLRYLSLLKLCDFTFVVFLVSWLLSRQIGLSLVIKTAYFDAPKYIPFKWDPKNGYYLTEGAYYGFIGAITILLCLASVWFCMACMVAVRVVRGEGAEDSRSDDEEEDELEVDVSEDGSTLSDVPESSSTVYDKAPAVSSVDAEVRKRK